MTVGTIQKKGSSSFFTASSICTHSSRVGTRIKQYAPSERSMRSGAAWSIWTIGIRYASVLPDPVSDLIITSPPFRISGIAYD